MRYDHITNRLAERDIHIDVEKISYIASRVECGAVILLKQEHKGQEGAYRTRTESNGDLVVLIVRHHYPVTIMYRRSNQPATAEAMNVDYVIDLTGEIVQ